MTEPQSFGYWLRRKRKSLDLTREELAGQVGCSAATIRKIEDEERRPSAQIAGLLANILGIDPADRAAFLRFARGDMLSAPPSVADTPPWQPAQPAPRVNLPATVTSLVGRGKEIADVRDYLLQPDIRLVTLIGPPGIGKTRLGIAVAQSLRDEFGDGVFFVALAPIDDPALVPATVVQTLGYMDKKSQPALDMLKSGIAHKRLLLVLDNCEHLIDSVADLAAALLGHCPNLKIIATSRETLRIPGEWQYAIPALGVPAATSVVDVESATGFSALTLFTERARAARPGFALTPENVAFVASICYQLDGLPLAIELIASRVRVMSISDLLAHMSDAFVLSADGMRAVSARQKTLGNAIGWSYDSLPQDEQQVFAGLGVFVGGFTLDAAEAVFNGMSGTRTVADVIMALSDKSLLQRVVDDRERVRFNMPVTIRQFALERLRQRSDEADVRNRHLAYFISLAGRGNQELRGPHQVNWGEILENEIDNLRAALEWGVSSRQTGSSLRLLGALGWPWEVRGHYAEMRAWLERIRSLPDVSDHPLLLARVLNHIGRHSWTQERIREARSLLEESCTLCEQQGEAGEEALADALNWLALVRLFNDRDAGAARRILEHSLEISTRRQLLHDAAVTTFHLGLCESILENDVAAISLLEESRESFRKVGDLFFMARAALFLGYIYIRHHDFDRARFYLEEHLRLDTEIQFWDGIAEGWRDLGNLYSQQQRFEQSSEYYDACLRVCQERGLQKNEAYYAAGLIALKLDRYALAHRRFLYPLEQLKSSGRQELAGVLLLGMAAVFSGVGDHEMAARLGGAGRAVIDRNGEEFPEHEYTELERHIRQARDRLGEAVFERLAAEGRAMSLEQAVDEVLRVELEGE